MSGERNICLGYVCACGDRVIAYRFRNVNGHWQPDHAVADVIAECPSCKLVRVIRLEDIQTLDRWRENTA